jgi:hypothetical protein
MGCAQQFRGVISAGAPAVVVKQEDFLPFDQQFPADR